MYYTKEYFRELAPLIRLPLEAESMENFRIGRLSYHLRVADRNCKEVDCAVSMLDFDKYRVKNNL